MSETTTDTEVDPKPRRFDWLRPPKGGPGGTMSLWDHLRELRYRVTVSVIAVMIASIGAAFYYNSLVSFVMAPWHKAKTILEQTRGASTMVVNNGVTAPFTLSVIICIVAGIIVASPVWLYQLWAFVAPGLLSREKKYALAFVGCSLPLFLSGCVLGYVVWPKGIEVLLSFTPKDQDITNMLEMTNFLSTEIKVVLVFGLSFILPVVVVGLNMAGIVRGYQLKKARKGVIFGSVVLSAVATPTTDPFSMMALAIPVTAMFMIAEVICRVWDKKRGISEEVLEEFNINLDDDQ